MSRLAQAWVDMYTLAVPVELRVRRRAELASHCFEAAAAGQTGQRLLTKTARGALDDLRWCQEERDRVSWAPMVFAPMGSTVVAAICMTIAFAASCVEGAVREAGIVRDVSPPLAATVLVLSFADLVWRRRRPRPEVLDDPIFP